MSPVLDSARPAIDSTQHVAWIASRAAGIVALGLLTLAVALGLVISGKLSEKPGRKCSLMIVHEVGSLGAMLATALHGAVLLGDGYLKPGLADIALPFASSYRPLWTGLGILAFYVSLLLGLSFYLRRLIGPSLWRKLHRIVAVAWLLGMAHTLGAGTDSASTWMRVFILVQAETVCVLLIARILPHRSRKKAAKESVERSRVPQIAARTLITAESGGSSKEFGEPRQDRYLAPEAAKSSV